MSQACLYETLLATESLYGDRPAIRFIEEVDQCEPALLWNYSELLDRLRGAANLFHRLGVGADATVALLVPNVPYAQVALFAAEIVGRALPINPLLPDEHIVHLLNATEAAVLVVGQADDRIDRIQSNVPSLRHVFTLDAGAGGLPGAIEGCRRDEVEFPPRTSPAAIVATFHTGGTTGTPKLVQHQQANQLAVAAAMIRHASMSSNDVLVNALPLFHVAGSMCFALTCMVAGACQVLCTVQGARHPDFISKHWTMLENNGATLLTGVPTTIGALAPEIPEAPPVGIRMVMTGGAPLPISIEAALRERLDADICIIYGMTECAGLLAMGLSADNPGPGWIGPAVEGMEIRIVEDPRAAVSVPVAAMRSGHVITKGATVGPGYRDAALNGSLFTPDGWLITGDLGMMDARGNLRLTGRAKDLIIRSGHNIDPAVIEEAAMTFPGVEAAAAVAAPDGYAGELPVLFVQPGAAQEIDEAALLDLIRTQVEPPAVPKWIETLETLPLTPVGKIYKPALAARAIERTIRQLLDSGDASQVSLTVTEGGGTARIVFGAAPEDRDVITKVMAPLSLEYEVSEVG